jgi:fructose-1,6-bisphosphatase/inositol monophosphatase family enzyme
MELRGTVAGHEVGAGQLKTSTDMAAEGWVVGYLQACFPQDLYLAEERCEGTTAWPGAATYWTVDALDGTRSYVDGYPGFCVQVAYVQDGRPCLGVIAEPVTGAVYAAAVGGGAWRLQAGEALQLATSLSATMDGLRFVDSTRPTGSVGALFARCNGSFVECGSVGLKICRVVEGAADVYAKRFRCKLWDVAPGAALAAETGAMVSDFSGAPIEYSTDRILYDSILVAPARLHSDLVTQLTRECR